MDDKKRCPDCDSEMERGFIPLRGHDGGLQQSQWHRGDPEEGKFLGLTGFMKINKSLLKPITCFRCTNCGLLKYYAI